MARYFTIELYILDSSSNSILLEVFQCTSLRDRVGFVFVLFEIGSHFITQLGL